MPDDTKPPTAVVDFLETEDQAVLLLNETDVAAILRAEPAAPPHMVKAIEIAVGTTRAIFSKGGISNRQVTMDEVRRALSLLGDVTARSATSPLLNSVIQFARLALALSASHECRMATPYAPMRVVRDADGNTVWRCTHQPAHESPA